MSNQRSERSTHPARFLPTPRDREVLDAVRTHGYLAREHIRQLFFRRDDGSLRSIQCVNARLRKLVEGRLLTPVVVSSGRGSGPYAYALASRGRLLATGVTDARSAPQSVWHALEIAEFRVALEQELIRHQGELCEWQGEPVLRGLLGGRRGAPLPDALVHWRLGGAEGVFLLEWDRGTESLAIVTTKLTRYQHYLSSHTHHELLPGLGLRPRVAVVLSSPERARRLATWLTARRSTAFHVTVFVGVSHHVLAQPLAPVWWRSDKQKSGALFGY